MDRPDPLTHLQATALRLLLAAGATDEAERKAVADDGLADLPRAVIPSLARRDLAGWRAEGEGHDRVVRYWLTPEGLHLATQLHLKRAA